MPDDFEPRTTELDPFRVAPQPPLWRTLPVFLLLLPVSVFSLVMLGLSCVLLLPTFKRQELPTRDWRARLITFWMLAAVRMRLRVTDHNPSKADHARIYLGSHICLFESIILIRLAGHIRTIASDFTRKLPVFGKVVEASDPIFVKPRRSGQGSVTELLLESLETTPSRHSIFPEGTFTNGESLLSFRAGGFVLGKPVTPVVFKYPEYVPFWNREESSFPVQLYRLMARLYTPVDVVILPTWHPSAEEIADPQLFSQRVRRLMAWHLQVPLSSKSQRDSPNFKQDRARRKKARAAKRKA